MDSDRLDTLIEGQGYLSDEALRYCGDALEAISLAEKFHAHLFGIAGTTSAMEAATHHTNDPFSQSTKNGSQHFTDAACVVGMEVKCMHDRLESPLPNLMSDLTMKFPEAAY